jgi:hypothetical protein
MTTVKRGMKGSPETLATLFPLVRGAPDFEKFFQIHVDFFPDWKNSVPSFQIGDFYPSVCKTAGVKYALQRRTLRHFGPVKAREIGNFSKGGGRSQNPFAWFLSRVEPLIGAPDAL